MTAQESQPLLPPGNEIQHYAAVDDPERQRVNGSHDDSQNPDLAPDFDSDGRFQDPQDWPKPFKWFIVSLLFAMAFTVTFNCISVVPIATRIVSDLTDGEPNKSASVLLVTIWELGEAAGPLLIAPLSEVVGRYPVMNGANVLFIAATALAALSQGADLFIGARALTGLAVAVNVLNPAIVGDLFGPDERGSPMSFMMLAPLLGGAVGPAISGAVAQSSGWRVVLWMSVALATTCELLFLFFFRETYKVVILKQKHAAMAKQRHASPHRTIESGDSDTLKPSDGGRQQQSGRGKLVESILRPFLVIGGSGVLASLSLYCGVMFSHFYNLSVTLPPVLEKQYGLSPAQTGACFLPFTIGSIGGLIICNATIDPWYKTLKAANAGIGLPEFRLPLVIIGGLTTPFALAAYGWFIEYNLPLPYLLLTVVLIGFTMLLGFVPVMAYVVDASGVYSASGMTGLIVVRCLFGTFLPLATGPMIEDFGFGRCFTVLSLVTMGLTASPILLRKYGVKLRQLSKYTRGA